MEQHHIEIEIRPDGEVKVHITGAKGRQCLSYAEFLKQLVGPIRSRELTHEHYEPEPQTRLQLDLEQKIEQRR